MSSTSTVGLGRIEILGASPAEPAWALFGALALLDPPLAVHALRGSTFACVLAAEAQITPDRAEVWGFLLRDLGMLEIPPRILGSSASLSAEGRRRVTAHPRRSAEVLRHVPELDAAVPIVACHHEAWDGSGYPQGLRAEAIPPAARVLAVADAFAAMTDDRSHRSARSPEQAAEEIVATAGRQFDPGLAPTVPRLLEALPHDLVWAPGPAVAVELFGPRFREHTSRATDLGGAQLEALFTAAMGMGAAEAARIAGRSEGTQRTWMSSVRRALACPSRVPVQRFLAQVGRAVYGTALERWRDRAFAPLRIPGL